MDCSLKYQHIDYGDITCDFFFVCLCKVMEVLMSLQGSQMDTDDPTTSYMLQVYVLCLTMYRKNLCLWLLSSSFDN